MIKLYFISYHRLYHTISFPLLVLITLPLVMLKLNPAPLDTTRTTARATESLPRVAGKQQRALQILCLQETVSDCSGYL